jgi:HSP20 family protein
MARPKRSKIKPSRSRDEVRAREMVPKRVDQRGKQEQRSMRLNSLFDDFRRDIEGIMNPWSSGLEWRFPRDFGMVRPVEMEQEEEAISRTPLVDMVDIGDRYFLRLELPGIDKDKVQLTATDDSLEISAEQSEEETDEDKSHKYIYNERSYRSFYRSIPIPEEILSSKITAKMKNGILKVEKPKKTPTRPFGDGKRIEVE